MTSIGAEIVKQYEKVKQGWVENIYKRQAGNWRKVWTRVTDEFVLVSRSSSVCCKLEAIKFSYLVEFQMKVADTKLSWKLVSEIAKVDDESVADKPTEFVFYLQYSTTRKYFAATSEKNMLHWIEEGKKRISAFSR